MFKSLYKFFTKIISNDTPVEKMIKGKHLHSEIVIIAIIILSISACMNKSINASQNLFRAVKEENIEEVIRSIKRGADVNITDENGRTALMFAAEKGNLEITKLLIDNGADVNASNYWRGTALMSAVSGGNAELVELLIQNGADVNARAKFAGSVMRLASIKKDSTIIRLLSEARAKY